MWPWTNQKFKEKNPKSIYEVVKSTAGQTAVDKSEIDFVYTNVKKNKDIKKLDLSPITQLNI